MMLFAGTVALLACLLVSTNGQIQGAANVESDRVIKVQTVKEIFRNRNNTALEINIQKKLVIHNIIEMLEMLHLACIEATSPDGGREVCRKKISGVVKHYTNLCFDVIELYSYMHYSKSVNLNEPGHQRTLGKIAANLYGGA